jgi:hypothetical protein
MKPTTGKAGSSGDPNTNTNNETAWIRDYICDSCGYPQSGSAKVEGVNERIGVNDQDKA